MDSCPADFTVIVTPGGTTDPAGRQRDILVTIARASGL